MILRSIVAPLVMALTCAAGNAAAADLMLTQTGGGPASAGQTRNFAINVSSLMFSLPPGVAITVETTLQGFTQVNASGSGWTCSVAGQIVTCTRSGGLAQGGALPPITVTAVVGSGTAYSSCAVVSHEVNASVRPDQVAANNTACVNGVIGGVHDPRRSEAHDPKRSSETHDPQRSGETHDPRRSETHDPRRSETHDPRRSEAHDPRRSETHDPRRSETHDPRRSEAHDPRRSDTHDPRRSETHDPRRSETHDPRRSDTHDPRRSETHDPRRSRLSGP